MKIYSFMSKETGNTSFIENSLLKTSVVQFINSVSKALYARILFAKVDRTVIVPKFTGFILKWSTIDFEPSFNRQISFCRGLVKLVKSMLNYI